MAFGQVASLHLRGSLCTQTLKNLPENEKDELDRTVQEIAFDPILAPCKTEFCNALARTIHNEYEDRKVGEQDYLVAITRAVLAAKYGYGNKEPVEAVLTNPLQRKKWFQTWVFQYLRQILRENNLPVAKENKYVELPADEAALYEVQQALAASLDDIHDHHYKRYLKSLIAQLIITDNTEGYKLEICLWSFPVTLEERIKALTKIYREYGVEVTLDEKGLIIKQLKEEMPLVSIRKKFQTQLKSKSFDATDHKENNQREWLESEALSVHRKEPAMESETLEELRKRVPSETLPILDIFMEDHRPEEYIQKFGTKPPRIAHVAEYLGKSPREVKKSVETIRHHCLALGVGR